MEAAETKPASAEEAFTKFSLLLRAQRNVKPVSLNTYLGTLRRFQRWCESRGVEFKDWNANLVTEYIASFDHPSTRHHFAMTLKYFFRVAKYPDAEQIKVPPRPKRKLPDVLREPRRKD